MQHKYFTLDSLTEKDKNRNSLGNISMELQAPGMSLGQNEWMFEIVADGAEEERRLLRHAALLLHMASKWKRWASCLFSLSSAF